MRTRFIDTMRAAKLLLCLPYAAALGTVQGSAVGGYGGSLSEEDLGEYANIRGVRVLALSTDSLEFYPSGFKARLPLGASAHLAPGA